MRPGPLFRPIAVLAGLACAAGLAACSRTDSRSEAFAQLPDWRGVWIADGFEAGISGFDANMGTQDAKPHPLVSPEAPWTDEGRAKLQQMFAGQADRKAAGWGYPMMMKSPAPLQFLITPEEVLIINMYQEARHVYTDREHPPADDLWATTWGDSVGHWEGDTLVIDTVAVREPNRFFQMTPPLSDNAHYVERLRMTAPDLIEGELSIEDAAILSQRWVIPVAYRRTANIDRLVHDAFDNDRSEVENGVFTIAPTAP